MTAALLLTLFAMAGCAQTPAIPPTPTPEPIVPTRTPVPQATATTEPVPPTPTATLEAPPTPSLPALSAEQAQALSRVGAAGGLDQVQPAARLGLRFGHFTFWRTWADLPDVPGMTYWQTVRLGQIGEWGEWPGVSEVIAEGAERYPGSFWIVGNEPDVRWQDNATPDEYARAYHDIYHFVKEHDSSAQVVAGNIALPTPLRLAYLDRVLAAYEALYSEPMPVDLWAIHLFTLREEADSWGIGIPPGFDDTAGQLYEIEDHGDIELLKSHVVAFRDWMAVNGYGDVPLAVTEFGILLPEDYGFPPEFVERYLVEGFTYLLNETGENGLAADDGRLVQYAFWYSLFDDGEYKTGNLYNGREDELTSLGESFVRLTQTLSDIPPPP